MTATALPRFTGHLSEHERRALLKAIRLNGAALVKRLEHGIYEVPSATRDGQTHIVSGIKMDASDHCCTCEAGTRGLRCWHVESVRLRRVQEEAKRQARRLAANQGSDRTLNPDAHVTVAAPVVPASVRQPLRRVALV